MRTLSLAAFMLLLTACPNGEETDTTETDTDTDTDADAVFEDYINITEAMTIAAGECWTPGDAWLTETPDTAKQVTLSGTVEVRDFESDDRASGLTVDIFSDDDVTGTPDQTQESDQNGEVVVDLPVCQPMGYRSSDPAGEAKDTYESHQFIGYPGDDVPLGVTEFNSVSRVTYLIIPSLLGISPDPTKSIIAGTAYDCNDDPIEGVQVIAKVNGEIPNGLITKYFVDDFPNRDQPHTSADGLWIAINVPVGDVTVEMWGIDGSGDPQLLGSTQMPTFADSINIANIPIGHDNGIKYPDSCLPAAE